MFNCWCCILFHIFSCQRSLESPVCLLSGYSPCSSGAWQLFFWITDLCHEDFTSGSSKGTSWPLLFRISASKRRVLSLGMTFSSCIFVHMASAFCQLFVFSENKVEKAVMSFAIKAAWRAYAHVAQHASCIRGKLLHSTLREAIKALIWSTDRHWTML